MNFKELAENLGLEEDEFQEIVELFLETSDADLHKLRSAIDREDTQQAIEAAHSIKGASGNLGFMAISEKAKNVEIKAREKDLSGANEAVENIKKEVDRIAQALKT
ncbi:MAG: Hpt domain-containing protein [Deltaproteobacteria bacterium]|nr:Hpt domain-containing protein [Deltaproteobacteria bacterium]